MWTRRWLCCLAHNWPNPLRMSCGSALRALFWAAKTVNFSSIWYGCTIFSLSTVKIMMSKKNYQENSGLWCCWLIVDGWSLCILTCQLHVDLRDSYATLHNWPSRMSHRSTLRALFWAAKALFSIIFQMLFLWNKNENKNVIFKFIFKIQKYVWYYF